MRIPVIPPRHVPRTGDDTPARSLLRYIWRMSGWHQALISLLALAVAALSMAPLELQRRIVNQAIGNGEVRLLALLGVLYLTVLLVQGGLKYLLRIYQGWLSESAVRYSRRYLIERSESRANNASRETGDGRAVSVIGPELDKLGGFVGEGISQPVVNVGMLVVILGYMLVVQTTVALVCLLFFLPQIALAPIMQNHINRLTGERVALMRRLSENVANLGNIDRGNAEWEGLDARTDDIYANRMRIFVIKFALKALVNLLTALGPLSVLVVGGYFVIEGRTTIGVVVAFMSGFERLAAPLRELLGYYRIAAQTDVQHRMIARWMEIALGRARAWP